MPDFKELQSVFDKLFNNTLLKKDCKFNTLLLIIKIKGLFFQKKCSPLY